MKVSYPYLLETKSQFDCPREWHLSEKLLLDRLCGSRRIWTTEGEIARKGSDND